MAKRAPRLQFTEEERASPELAPAIQKADKQIKKLEKAEAKVPKKEVKQRVVDSDGKITTRLSFEEKKPPSKLSHAAKVSGDTVLHGVHRKVQSNDGTTPVDAIPWKMPRAMVGRGIRPRSFERTGREKGRQGQCESVESGLRNGGFLNCIPLAAKTRSSGSTPPQAGRGTASPGKASEKKRQRKAQRPEAQAQERLFVGLIAAVFLLFTNLFSSCSLLGRKLFHCRFHLRLRMKKLAAKRPGRR